MTEIVRAVRNLPEVQREQDITAYLSQARDRLADALAATGPEAVASIKAEVSTVAEMTKQLGLSKECRDDATEMVRRAEYALGKAIRKGQEDGTVETEAEAHVRATLSREVKMGRIDRSVLDTAIKPKPRDFATHGELYASGERGILDLADNATDEQFEEALTEAREEGNLSRANVVRKVKGQKAGQRSRQQLADEIAELAEKGNASPQIARIVGVGEEWVRETARDYAIEIPADKAVGRTRRVDSSRVVREAVSTLEGLLITLPLVDMDDLDPREASEWTASLDQSIRALNWFNKKIKEAVL
jgi:hypothetical protein